MYKCKVTQEEICLCKCLLQVMLQLVRLTVRGGVVDKVTGGGVEDMRAEKLETVCVVKNAFKRLKTLNKPQSQKTILFFFGFLEKTFL